MPILGKLLRPIRAGGNKGPLATAEFAAPESITVTSDAFGPGEAIPVPHTGAKSGGDNVSPALHWEGVPAEAKSLVLIMDDADAPGPKPFVHTVAVLPADSTGLVRDGLAVGTTAARLVPTGFGDGGYLGPHPLAGHGPHHYRFHLLAVDVDVPPTVADYKTLLTVISGHVICRGTLVGTFERWPTARPSGAPGVSRRARR